MDHGDLKIGQLQPRQRGAVAPVVVQRHLGIRGVLRQCAVHPAEDGVGGSEQLRVLQQKHHAFHGLDVALQQQGAGVAPLGILQGDGHAGLVLLGDDELAQLHPDLAVAVDVLAQLGQALLRHPGQTVRQSRLSHVGHHIVRAVPAVLDRVVDQIRQQHRAHDGDDHVPLVIIPPVAPLFLRSQLPLLPGLLVPRQPAHIFACHLNPSRSSMSLF